MKFLTEYRGWIILLALVAIMIGLYFYLEKDKEEEETTETKEVEDVKDRVYLPMQ